MERMVLKIVLKVKKIANISEEKWDGMISEKVSETSEKYHMSDEDRTYLYKLFREISEDNFEDTLSKMLILNSKYSI